MDAPLSPLARRLGLCSALAIVVLDLAYAITLGIGLATLPSPDAAIANPWFTILELLILATAPAMVALMAAVHARAPADARPFALLALAFMAMLAAITCSVHFVILTVGQSARAMADPALRHALAFEWPSVVYALDIMAWDLFFALSMLAAAVSFRGGRLARSIRVAMIASAGLALAGLIGVPLGNMQLRNIGVIGYVGGFLIVAVLLAALFCRSVPKGSDAGA